MPTPDLPRAPTLEAPILECLKSAAPATMKVAEIDAAVAKSLGLSAEQLKVAHDAAKPSGRTEFAYRMAWARTRLKAKGVIENRGFGQWAISGG